jgi:hypothetical protein
VIARLHVVEAGADKLVWAACRGLHDAVIDRLLSMPIDHGEWGPILGAGVEHPVDVGKFLDPVIVEEQLPPLRGTAWDRTEVIAMAASGVCRKRVTTRLYGMPFHVKPLGGNS